MSLGLLPLITPTFPLPRSEKFLPSLNWRRLLDAARETMNPHTWRATRSDFGKFADWVARLDADPLPTSAIVLKAYVDATRGRYATMRRRISSVGLVHRLAGLKDPTQSKLIRNLVASARREDRASGHMVDKSAERTLQRMTLSNVIDRLNKIEFFSSMPLRNIALLNLLSETRIPPWKIVRLRWSDVQQLDHGVEIIVPSKQSPDRTCAIDRVTLSQVAASAFARWGFRSNGINDHIFCRLDIDLNQWHSWNPHWTHGGEITPQSVLAIADHFLNWLELRRVMRVSPSELSLAKAALRYRSAG